MSGAPLAAPLLGLAFMGCVRAAPPAHPGQPQPVVALDRIDTPDEGSPWTRLDLLDAEHRDPVASYRAPDDARAAVRTPLTTDPRITLGYLAASAAFEAKGQRAAAAQSAWGALAHTGRVRASPTERAELRARARTQLARLADARGRREWARLLRLAAALDRTWAASPGPRFAHRLWHAVVERIDADGSLDAAQAGALLAQVDGARFVNPADVPAELAGARSIGPHAARLLQHLEARDPLLDTLSRFARDKPDVEAAVAAVRGARYPAEVRETTERLIERLARYEGLVARYERRYATPPREVRERLCWSTDIGACLLTSRMACAAGDATGCAEMAAIHGEGRGGLPVAPVRARQAIAAGCELGDPAACRELAARVEDAAEADRLLQTACAGDDLEACASLGFARLSADPESARRVLERACTGSVARGCHGLALVTDDADTAARLLDEACDLGVPAACTDLGVRTEDAQTATALLRRACDLGHAAGCQGLAERLVEVDPAASAQLSQKACHAGVSAGCAALGVALAEGRGVAADPQAARPLLEAGCEQGHDEACLTLGRQLHDGVAGERDLERAGRLLRALCANGVAAACLDRAAMYLAGPEPIAEAAAELWRVACERGSAEGCVRLGDAHVDGVGVEKDAKEATRRYEQACADDHAAACALLAERVRRGRGARRSGRAARELKKKACELGHADACK